MATTRFSPHCPVQWVRIPNSRGNCVGPSQVVSETEQILPVTTAIHILFLSFSFSLSSSVFWELMLYSEDSGEAEVKSQQYAFWIQVCGSQWTSVWLWLVVSYPFPDVVIAVRWTNKSDCTEYRMSWSVSKQKHIRIEKSLQCRFCLSSNIVIQYFG